MKNYVYLKNWNLYSNRTVLHIKEATFSEWVEKYDDIEYVIKDNVNYVPYDGVNSSTVVNWDLDWTPDYLLVLDEDGNIISTWFVLDFVRTRNGQYKASLKRDTVNDFYDSVLSATTYIEKATIKDINNPLIFNDEGMIFNQIKQSETLLKDDTNSAWIVGYVSKSQLSENKTVASDIITDPTYTHLTFPFPQYLPIGGITEYIVKGPFDYLYYDLTSRNPITPWRTFVTPNPKVIKGTDSQTPPIFNNTPTFNIDYSELLNSSYSVFSNLNESRVVDLLNLQYKTLLAADNKMYKIYIQELTEKEENTRTLSSGSQIALLYQKYTGQDLISTGKIKGFARMSTYKIKFVETTAGQLLVNIKNNRARCLDAPYDMFAIPYNSIKVQYLRGREVEELTVDPDSAVAIAQAIQVQLTDSYVYDIQLLPYCPIPNIGTGNGINIVELGSIEDTNNLNVEVIWLGSYPKNVLIWCRSSIGSLTIPYSHQINNIKEDNETQMTRLCSPNYSGIFEFNPAKNYGINYINVNYTYKPYNPFIHLCPDFKGLYGSNFNDSRGLICGGDFSLAKLNDAWANYELQNKNYQAIFDRQIQNMDVNHKWDRLNNILGAGTGSIGGGTQGAIAGSLMGVSGLATGAVGAGVSALGGVADVAISEAKYKEAKSYTTDLYSYSLGNIKALPTTISKTTALTNNNKIWPFIEEYDCTETEKKMLRKKLKWNGMTVMSIGNIGDYVYSGTEDFLQGQIIRLQDINEDNHIVDDIYNEIKRGLYFRF